MLSNAVASGLTALSAGEPAASVRGRAAHCVFTVAERVRVVAPMSAAVRGTRVPTIGADGNGNAGTAAAAAPRNRCG